MHAEKCPWDHTVNCKSVLGITVLHIWGKLPNHTHTAHYLEHNKIFLCLLLHFWVSAIWNSFIILLYVLKVTLNSVYLQDGTPFLIPIVVAAKVMYSLFPAFW